MRHSPIRALLASLLVASALLLASSARAEVTVTFKKSTTPGSVLLTVRGAGPTLHVAVPWGVAHQLAFQARHGGPLLVSTAQDGFTGGLLRLVSGAAKDTVVLDRTRRAGPNGQSGVAALRFQRGVGPSARAHFLGRTVGKRQLADRQVAGASSASRSGRHTYLINAYSLGLDDSRPVDGKTLGWYSTPTGKVTTDLGAPLVPFAPRGSRAASITGQPARIIGAEVVGAD